MGYPTLKYLLAPLLLFPLVSSQFPEFHLITGKIILEGSPAEGAQVIIINNDTGEVLEAVAGGGENAGIYMVDISQFKYREGDELVVIGRAVFDGYLWEGRKVLYVDNSSATQKCDINLEKVYLVNFSYYPVSPCEGENVYFFPSIEHVCWDFGDGNFSEETYPVHRYHEGIYEAKLKIGETEMSKLIKIDKRLHANFTYVVDGDTVYFYDKSVGGINYTWYFGNGSISHEKNPARTWSGSCDVILEIRDEKGNTDICIKRISKNIPFATFVFKPKDARVNEEMEFIARGGEKIEWDFDGDGQYEMKGKIVHYIWNERGKHFVTMRAWKGEEYCTVTKAVYISSIPRTLYKIDEKRVNFFVPVSDVEMVRWNFGDGVVEVTKNNKTSHEYRSGTYSVNITVIFKNGTVNEENIQISIHEKMPGFTFLPLLMIFILLIYKRRK